jgi:hypothetical protein
MGEVNYFKFFSFLAFLAFAAISCWATAESLHLLLSSWPLVFCWVVSVGFFVIASIGTKMIVDSLNQNVYIEKRGILLVGGIILVILFWLICVMPTNTHTFFFRNVINEKVTQDITTTQNYLDQIKNNQVKTDSIQAKIDYLDNALGKELQELVSEINNSNNPGYGPNATAILEKIGIMLGQGPIEPLSYVGTSPSDRKKLREGYLNKINDIKQVTVANWGQQLQNATNQVGKQDAEKAYNEIEDLKNKIKAGKINLNDAKEIESVSDKINRAYSVIKSNPQAVKFLNDSDKKAYTAENPVSKVKRLTSVFDVWKDFIKGAYAGSGFLFWVIIAILIDIAAFIFFDLTFKK